MKHKRPKNIVLRLVDETDEMSYSVKGKLRSLEAVVLLHLTLTWEIKFFVQTQPDRYKVKLNNSSKIDVTDVKHTQHEILKIGR